MRRVAISLAVLLAPLPAHAARVAPHRKVRVHLDTEVFAWTHSRAPRGVVNAPPPVANTFGFGVGRPVTLDGALGTSVIALGVGYGVHRHLIVGARFGLNFNHTSSTIHVDGTSPPIRLTSTLFSTTLTPYFEILPLSEGTVLPYILLRTGFSTGFADRQDMDSRERERAIAPLVGVGVGAHAFVARHFSIDFGVGFDHRWRFFTLREETSDPFDPAAFAPWQHTSNVFTLAATLGLSTWF